MIKNWNELATLVVARALAMPLGTLEENKAWADADPDTQLIRRLYQVYTDAMANPPEGVIGVGIITYAEQKMVEAQEDMS